MIEVWSRKTGIVITGDDKYKIRNSYGDWKESSIKSFLKEKKLPKIINSTFSELLGRQPTRDEDSLWIDRILEKDYDVSSFRKTIEECQERNAFSKKVETLKEILTLNVQTPASVTSDLKDLKIKWVGPIGDGLYGRCTRSFLNLLVWGGAQVTFSQIGFDGGLSRDIGELDKAVFGLIGEGPKEYDIIVVNSNLPHVWEDVISKKLDCPVFGMPLFEETVPTAWSSVISKCNYLIACSEWNAKMLNGYGPKVSVVNIPFWNHLFLLPEEGEPLSGVDDDDFVFYTIQGINVLVYDQHFQDWDKDLLRPIFEDFVSEFCSDKVVLYVKTAVSDPIEIPFVDTSDKKCKIILDVSPKTEAHMWSLHDRGDCYVSFSKVPNLDAVDACWFTNPVIILGDGSQQDYVKGAVEASVKPLCHLNRLDSVMRVMYESPEFRKQSSISYRFVLRNLTPEKLAPELMNALVYQLEC